MDEQMKSKLELDFSSLHLVAQPFWKDYHNNRLVHFMSEYHLVY